MISIIEHSKIVGLKSEIDAKIVALHRTRLSKGKLNTTLKTLTEINKFIDKKLEEYKI